ncbi:MAG: hypothetical protein LUQ24_06900 [Methanobacterium sp.]|nr:hypothetical protein [Methanobacterium sp.]
MKRPMLLTMLLLFAVILLIPNIYATTTNQQTTVISTNTTNNEFNIENFRDTADNQGTTTSSKWGVVSTATNNQDLNLYSTNVISSTTSNKSQKTENIQYATAAAGDDTYSNVQNNWFTNKNITEAAGRVKYYIETNHRLPKNVTIGTKQVTMPQFLQLLTTSLIQINKGKNNNITLKTVDAPLNSAENIKTGSVNKTEYLTMASKIQSYIKSNSRAPNYASSLKGNVGFPSMIYLYSRILSYYDDNNVLPKSASLIPWTSISNQSSGNESAENTNSFTIAQIGAAAGVVKSFVEENKRLPNFVIVNGKQLTMPQFLQLVNTGILQIYNKNSTKIVVKDTGTAANPTEDLESGIIYKSEYIDLAKRIQNYLNSNGKSPNYASSTLGKIRYESLIYLESRILNFYAQNSALPRYAALNPWKTSDDTSNYSQYLQATNNCPSNSPTIINLANSITSGKTTAYDKAVAIFNWVNDNTTYSYYYNTVKGALGTLSSGSANCVDTTHLLIALTRAAGIPAKYEHGICTFSDGEFGHVWAQVYANGIWYYADAISPRNTFGVINNWDTSNWTLIGIYAELPF